MRAPDAPLWPDTVAAFHAAPPSASLPAVSVTVAVVDVADVMVGVREPLVPVDVGMWLGRGTARRVFVLVVRVVDVWVLVFERLVCVLVVVSLAEHQRETGTHDQTSG